MASKPFGNFYLKRVKGNMGGAMEKFPVNVHKYTCPKMCILTQNTRASEETHYFSFTFVALHDVCTKTWVDGLYNTFCTVHFRPKIQVNNVTSRSYCPKFPFTIFISMARYNIMLKVYRSSLQAFHSRIFQNWVRIKIKI